MNTLEHKQISLPRPFLTMSCTDACILPLPVSMAHVFCLSQSETRLDRVLIPSISQHINPRDMLRRDNVVVTLLGCRLDPLFPVSLFHPELEIH